MDTFWKASHGPEQGRNVGLGEKPENRKHLFFTMQLIFKFSPRLGGKWLENSVCLVITLQSRL